MDTVTGGFKKSLIKKHIPDIIISGILAAFLKISLNYKLGGTLFFGTAASNLGGAIMCWLGVCTIINLLDLAFSRIAKKDLSEIWKIKLREISARGLFWTNLLIIFILWLPYLIVTYPGSAWFDCSSSIKQMYGVTPLSNWNPIIQTFFIGGFVRLGDFLLDENFGLFLYNICQMVFSAGVISYGLTSSLIKKGKSVKVDYIIMLLVYSILPVYPLYVTSVGKDTNWSCCILLMAIILWKMQIDEDWIKRNRNRVFFVLCFLSICLLRNAGIYVAIPCAIVALIYSTSYRKLLAILSGVCILGVLFWANIFLPSIGVSTDGISRDSWNVQFQQMANFIKTYPDEITEDDISIINRMLSFEELSTKYNPNIVDTVTEVYYGDSISNEDLREFKQLYWRWFREHPECYLDAFVAKCIGYFTPIIYTSVKPFTIIGVSDVNCNVQSKLPEFHLYSVNDLTSYVYYVQQLQKTPVINLFTHCGFWTWLIFYSLFAAIKRNRKVIPMIMPFLVVIIGLTIVPTNNYFRYTLSLVFASPFLLYMIYSSQGGKDVIAE